MRIRLLKQFGLLHPGAIIEPQPKDVGRLLIERGVAELIEDEPRGGSDETNKAFQTPPAEKPKRKK